MNRSQSKIRHIQEANILLEKRLLNEQSTPNTWLSFPGDKNYQYQKRNGKWVAKILKTGKEIDMSKYPTTIQKLEKQFPNGVASGNDDKINTLQPKSITSLDTGVTSGNVSSTASTVNTATVKNETLPGASVYYPWVQDGKINFEKFKQSYKSDPNFQNWYSELVKLTPEQLGQVRKDWKNTGFPLSSNDKYKYDTNVGVGLAVVDIIRNAETAVANKGG
jgi:hypothetical protein